MGKGKGSVEYWVAQIQPGRVLYEIEGVSEELAREAFELAAQKDALIHHLCETDGDVMKAQEIREKSAGELKEQLLELLREQFNLRMQKATGQRDLSQTHLSSRSVGISPALRLCSTRRQVIEMAEEKKTVRSPVRW